MVEDLSKANTERLKLLASRAGLEPTEDRAAMISELERILEEEENRRHQQSTNTRASSVNTSLAANQQGAGSTAGTVHVRHTIENANANLPAVNTGFVYRDIENTIQTFSGDDHVQVGR